MSSPGSASASASAASATSPSGFFPNQNGADRPIRSALATHTSSAARVSWQEEKQPDFAPRGSADIDRLMSALGEIDEGYLPTADEEASDTEAKPTSAKDALTGLEVSVSNLDDTCAETASDVKKILRLVASMSKQLQEQADEIKMLKVLIGSLAH